MPEDARQDVASLINMMEDRRGTEPALYAAGPKLEYAQRIESLLDSLMSVRHFAHNSGEEEQALRSAYIALIYCASEAKNFRTDPYFDQALENEQLTLGKLADIMLAHMHDSPAAFMAHIVQHYVLLQHFGIGNCCKRLVAQNCLSGLLNASLLFYQLQPKKTEQLSATSQLNQGVTILCSQ